MVTVKNYKMSILLGIGIICMSFYPFAKDEKQSLARVSEVFDKLNAAASQNNKACYINYTVVSNLSAKGNPGKNLVSKSKFELISSRHQSRIYSNEMIVLKDEKNTFMILPSRKIIYWSDAVKGKRNENLYDKLKQMQDTIFNNVKKVECTEVKDKAYDQVITLYLNDKISRFIDIQKVVYYINTKTGLLNKVYIEYLPDRQYEKLEYEFNEISLNYEKVSMNIPVKKLVFESDKVLKKEYLGYKLIDNRKK